MRVRFDTVSKRFGALAVVDRVSFEVRDGELFFLVGPSGCGKTTILRLVAGFYQPDEGAIWFDDRRMENVPVHRRNTAMVFQNYALWPHMTVAENVAYGLGVRGVNGEEKRRRVREALRVVQMEEYAERRPNQLSGGQQQRVALARALVIEPDVLLLDEPLSNLDAKLRLEMREEIKRIHERLGITSIYVTHDQKEALSLAGRMAVVRAGRIEQIGTPREVYRAPANAFVADFIGETGLFEGRVVGGSGAAARVRLALGLLDAAVVDGRRPAAGERVLCGIRPESYQFWGESVAPPAGAGWLEAEVTAVVYLGEVEQYWLRIGSAAVRAIEQNPRRLRARGERLHVRVDPLDVMILSWPALEGEAAAHEIIPVPMG